MKLLNTLVCIIGLTSFSSSAKLVNAEHLDALYQKVTVANKTELGLIHIYSEFPDYRWVKDPSKVYPPLMMSPARQFFINVNTRQQAQRQI